MLYATLYNNGAATVQRYGQAARSNCKFNVDANSGHAFGIFMAAVGTLRPVCVRRTHVDAQSTRRIQLLAGTQRCGSNSLI